MLAISSGFYKSSYTAWCIQEIATVSEEYTILVAKVILYFANAALC
jgi:hypothetical protein